MFSSAILFSSKLCNPAFRANQNQLQCPDLRPWRGLNEDEEDDLLSLLPSHYPLRCGGASLPWPHCCTWKIRYNQGLIRFGLWIWVTWLQVEYPTIWGLNPTMKIINFFFSLISLYNNRNQWQLQRSIFEKNHTFYWTPGAAYYLFPDTTMFIHYSKCFFAFCTKYGNQPTITSFKDQHQYSISWSFIQKTIESFSFTVC